MCLAIIVVVLTTVSAKAAAGINKQISFQGKVVAKADGTNVTDGSYSFTFRIYTSSSGSTGSPCASACVWEETKSLTVTAGMFQTNLGDTTALPGSVDFNADTLYLSVKFNGDTEMSPRVRLTAVPYAFNADKLGGLSSSSFAQLSPGSQQTGSLNVSGDTNIGSGSSFKINGTSVCSGTTCTAASGSSFYIQNGTGLQTANFNIQSAAAGSIGGIIKSATSQTADLLELQNSSGNILTNFDSKGYLHVAKAAASSDTVVSSRVSGDTNDRFTVGADGLLSWGPGNAGTDTTLYRTGGNYLKTDGSFIAQNHVYTGSGSGNLVATLGVTTNTSGNVGAIIQGMAGQTADLFELQNSVGTVTYRADATGNITIGNVSNVGSGGRLFSDGLESGNTKLWSTGVTTQGSGSVTVDSTLTHHGKYSAKFTTSSGSATLQTLIAGATSMAVRSYVYVTSQNASDNYRFMTLSGSNLFSVYRDSSTGKLAAYNSLVGTSLGSTVLATGGWHEVEADVTYSASAGTITLYLDGTSVLSLTSQNTGTALPTSFFIGDDTNGRTATVNIDDVVVDSVRPGDGTSLSVADSLHVSGTSSFGGLALFQGGSNSTNAFQIQNTAGTSNTLMADTVNNRIGIGMAPASNTLDVTGTIGATSNITTGGAYQIGGTNVLSVSGNYNILRSANSSGGLQIWNAANSSAVATVSDAGALTLSSYLSASTLQTASGDLTINPAGDLKVIGSTANSSANGLNIFDSSGTNSLLTVRNDGVIAIGDSNPIDGTANAGDLSIDGNYWSDGTLGATLSCQGTGQGIRGTQVTGGIITGGACGSISGSLQDAYAASSDTVGSIATPSKVNEATLSATGISFSATVPTATVGNLMVIVVGMDDNKAAINSITDNGSSGGNTWTNVTYSSNTGSDGSKASIWYAPVTKTGTTSLTFHMSSSTSSIASNKVVDYTEWSNIDVNNANGVLLGSSAKVNSSTTAQSSQALTTTIPGALYIGGLSWNTSATLSSGPTGGGFTALTGVDYPAANKKLRPAYAIESTAGSYSTSWTLSAAATGGSVVAAFRPLASGGSTTIAKAQLDGTKDIVFQTSTGNSMLTLSNTTSTAVFGPGNTTTSADPAAGVNGAMYYNATLSKMRCYINGMWTNCSGVPYFPDRHWGLTAQNTATPGIFTGTSQGGDIGAMTYSGSGTATADSGQTEDSYQIAPTNSTNGNSATLITSDGTEERWRPYYTTRVRVSSTSSERIFIGMSTNSAGSMTDTPTTASWVGFRYSTSASDTTWKCGSGDGSNSTYSTVTSLPSISTSAYYDLTVDWTTSGQIVCTVRVSGGTSYSVTKTTNLPTSSTLLSYVHQITTLTTAVRQLEAAYIYIERN